MHLKKKPFISPRLVFIFCLSLTILLASQANAQSGRRLPKLPPKPTETTPPKEQPPAEETTAAKTREKLPLVSVLVTYQYDNFMGSHMLTNAVLDGCLGRLQKAMGVSAKFGRDMNRKEASDAAKASADTFVVWFELKSENFGPDDGRNSARSYYVSYIVFAHSTGKSKTSGHVYQRQRGTMPLPRTDIGADYNLRRAGQEMADRVLGALNLPLPPDRY
jgi:hypothetical protein